MFSDASLEARRAVDRHHAAFREDVAEQLRLVAERAGLAANITACETEIALEIAGSGPDGEGLRIVASFNDARAAMPGWVDWLGRVIK